MDALATQRWRDAVAYVDTAAFEMLRRDQLAGVWRSRNLGGLTVEVLMEEGKPKPTREEAEQMVRSLREAASHSDDFIGAAFAHVPTADSLEKLSTVEAAARGSWRAETPQVLALKRVAGQWRVRVDALDFSGAAGVVTVGSDDDGCPAKKP